MRKKVITGDERKLYRRYLLWCYKTTRESLERVDRKFTQLAVDYFLLKELGRAPESKNTARDKKCQAQIVSFRRYVAHKEKSAYSDKYEAGRDGEWKAEYWYLQKRLEAVKKAIRFFLGKGELARMETLYDEEMVSRILQARDHA